MKKPRFQSICLRSLEKEGGYSAGIGDFGGQTYMGISRRYFPNWKGWAKIDEIFKQRTIHMGELVLPVSDVLDLYKAEFWDKMGLDDVNDTGIVLQIFDHAINAGIGDAAKLAQLACFRSGMIDIIPDGIFGPKTRAALNEAANRNMRKLRRHMFHLRVDFYLKEANKNETQFNNFVSWISRTVHCYS